jgi:phosphotransferase system IIA component
LGVISGDTVTLGGTATHTFASANVGTGIAITTAGYTLGGDQAGNYTLTQPGLTANITAKALTVTGLAGVSREYDRTTTATVSGTAALLGVIEGDTVTLGGTATHTFASANVGTGIAITTTGYTLGGSQAGNYTLTQPGLTANITAKALTISGLSSASKVYDGTTTATISGSATLQEPIAAGSAAAEGHARSAQ